MKIQPRKPIFGSRLFPGIWRVCCECCIKKSEDIGYINKKFEVFKKFIIQVVSFIIGHYIILSSVYKIRVTTKHKQ